MIHAVNNNSFFFHKIGISAFTTLIINKSGIKHSQET